MVDESTYNILLQQIKDNDIKAYNRLYNSFYAPLCVFARRYLSDIETIEDCIQDVFLNIWKNRGEISIETSVRSYLLSATKNRCLSVIDKHKNKQTYEQYILNTYDEYSAEDLLSVEELKKIIDDTVNKLPEKLRIVFCMSRYEHLTYKEIAQRLNISVKTVESYMHKSLIFMSLHLKDYLPILAVLNFL